MKHAALLLGGPLAAALAGPAFAAPQLTPVWTDHAVIQRGQPIVVEGTAAPNAEVEVSLSGYGFEEITLRGRSGSDGRFAIELAPADATSEPLTLIVDDGSGTRAVVSDILVGDVWLCSGQSNMEFPVSRGLNGAAVAQASADDGLRLLVVPKATALVPQPAFEKPVQWTAASPQTVPTFSAACYFMARRLRETLGVPIGAVHSSWGGSAIRAWFTPEAGRKLYGDAEMALLTRIAGDPLGAVTEFAPVWENWWREGTDGQEPWRDPDALAWMPVPSIAPWPTWSGTPLATHTTGNVWFRRTLELTEEQAAAGGTLALGVIDDLDATWINGRPVGISFGWDYEREYAVPAAYLRAGANEILFAASNSYGSGGFSSSAETLAFTVAGGERIALGDGWRYTISAFEEMPPRAPWDGNAGIGVMHNRMIAPLGRFALAGAAWYQGESDVGIPGYGDRLRELFTGWRGQFGPQMRMLVVQLANYGPVAERPVSSGWAETRDIQRQAVAADARATLVSAIDIGERTDIHPANKTVLGERLAQAALGEAMPMPQRAARDAGAIVVTFSGVEGALSTWSGDHVLGVELCGETQESCRYAPATAAGSELRITPDAIPVTRVRYAWADSPVVNLFDARPVPVPGFEIPVEP